MSYLSATVPDSYPEQQLSPLGKAAETPSVTLSDTMGRYLLVSPQKERKPSERTRNTGNKVYMQLNKESKAGEGSIFVRQTDLGSGTFEMF